MMLTYHFAPELFVLTILLMALIGCGYLLRWAWRQLVASWHRLVTACAELKVSLQELRAAWRERNLDGNDS